MASTRFGIPGNSQGQFPGACDLQREASLSLRRDQHMPDIALEANEELPPASPRVSTPPVMTAEASRDSPSLAGAQFVSSFLPAEMQRAVWTSDDFIVKKTLYEGYSSQVTVVYDIVSRSFVALKMYAKARLSELNRAQVEREIRIHIDLNHMHIIQLYAAWQDNHYYYLVQEYAPEGDVFSEVHRRGGQLTEKGAVSMVLQPFLAALHYLHSRGIIHRDIKPENLLFAQCKLLKVADFGLAIDQSVERPVTRAGTLDYMAPEVVVCPSKRRPEDNKDKPQLAYSEQVDVWSVGILAYELLVGFPPFERDSRAATLECIMYSYPQFPLWMSDEAVDFIRRALSKDRSKRPSIHELLRHPWIQIHERRRSHRTMPTDFLQKIALQEGLSLLGQQQQQPQPQQPQQPQGAEGMAEAPGAPPRMRQTTSFGPGTMFGACLASAGWAGPHQGSPGHRPGGPRAPDPRGPDRGNPTGDPLHQGQEPDAAANSCPGDGGGSLQRMSSTSSSQTQKLLPPLPSGASPARASGPSLQTGDFEGTSPRPPLPAARLNREPDRPCQGFSPVGQEPHSFQAAAETTPSLSEQIPPSP
eukprot:CAMPEP_0177601282 /NCGR_PEP_ID=MMETSP0419_2-20121207/14156_1 /TAXON_ID=582737 /ORGANISM="Tetraselmis sp., Strain GSL018" /LENGTH=585 /DNA_ID=CAMNT_0019094497 /DNA_START=318 /DNA_END=2076 /DNA_ORIENTATION=-